MPEIHGFELIDLLQDVSPPPRIIAVSGAGPYQLEMAKTLGARFTLEKPVIPDQLLSAVEPLLQSRT